MLSHRQGRADGSDFDFTLTARHPASKLLSAGGQPVFSPRDLDRCFSPNEDRAMIYQAYETQSAVVDLMRPLASVWATTLRLPWPSFMPRTLKGMAAKLDTFADLRVTAVTRPFGIEPVQVGNKLVDVQQAVVTRTPFATLLRFRKDIAAAHPKVLVVAPMSGHFATLLRGTVQTLLIDHDVYITDWHNIRDVPLEAGIFDLSTYTEQVMHFMRVLGEGSHLVAVCQPAVPCLAAASIMAEDGDAATPRSMTLMAGPIDTRINPTAVNRLAIDKPIGWFRDKLTDIVPRCYKGAGRRVYPGFMQLAAFMSMNAKRHEAAFDDMAKALAGHDHTKYATMKAFYDEYFAVMDLPGDFYLETVQQVFQNHALPLGTMTISGRKVDPRAIQRTALLTVEGERDDICGLGQTKAAHDLCSSIEPLKRMHHVQTGVGHYGVFSGRRWTADIYPKVRDIIAMAH